MRPSINCSFISVPIQYFSFKTLNQLILLASILAGLPNTAHCQNISEDTITLISDTSWENHLTKNSSEISFATSLNQNERLTIALSNVKKPKRNPDIVTITTTDQDCIGEHETSINYMEKRKNIIFKYFSKKEPWKSDIHFHITWTKENIITIKLNNESITIKAKKKPKYIYIKSNESIQIKKFFIKSN